MHKSTPINLRALDDGHWDLFEHIVENEALTMCALFLSSGTSKFLPSSNLIEWAQYIRDKREELSVLLHLLSIVNYVYTLSIHR